MTALGLTRKIIYSCLQLDPEKEPLDASTPLLGGFPDFNSLAIATIVETIETQLDCMIEDEELSAEIFETVGSLSEFVEGKM